MIDASCIVIVLAPRRLAPTRARAAEVVIAITSTPRWFQKR